MNDNLVSQYYLKIQKDILFYSALLAEIIKLKELSEPTNTNELFQEFIKIYYDKYYRDSKSANYVVPKYFKIDDDNPLVDNRLIASIVDYFEIKNNTAWMLRNKEVIVSWSIIISLGYEIAEMTNPFSNSIEDIREYIIKRLNDVKPLSYLNVNLSNDYVLDKLCTYANHSHDILKQYFKSFNLPRSYNTFVDLTGDNKYYLVEYAYVIENLSKYKKKDIVKFADKTIEESLFFISCNLLSMTILKEILCKNDKKQYVLRISSNIYRKNKCLDNLNIVFRTKEIIDYISLAVNSVDYLKDKTLINKLRNMGYKIIIDCTKDKDIGSLINEYNYKDTLLINKDFEIINKEYWKFINERNINYIFDNKINQIMKNVF